MPISGQQGFKWNNATQGVDGQICYLSAEGVADYTTAVTQIPEGMLLNKPKQYETAQLGAPAFGEIAEVLADGTVDIAVGDLLMTNSTGRAVKAVKQATVLATVAWVIGHALEAYTAAADGIIKVRWHPHEGQYVAGT